MRGGAVTTISDVPTTLGELIIDLQSARHAGGGRDGTTRRRRGPDRLGDDLDRGRRGHRPDRVSRRADSPYTLECEDDGYAIYRDGVRMAAAEGTPRPKYYDLETADGVPYWKIALLHLDSLASTVVQTCGYWGNSRPVRVLRHRPLARRRAHDRQEDARAARRGGGRRQGTRRRRRRDAHHRQLERTRPRRAATSPSAARP